ncbi:MAG: PQQ-dependent sugar dehydrogenase [bacterium]|nr:PQQ-dependent sugar dehydrogenase [bacterium]
MKGIVVFGFIIILMGAVIFLTHQQSRSTITPSAPSTTSALTSQNEVAPMTVVATGLDTPWAIAFLPDQSMLVTERKGMVRRIDTNGVLDSTPVATLSQVKKIGEGGLLGITTHPDFENNKYVYLYYTYSSNDNNTLNRVVRMTYQNNTLTDEKIIIDKIPGSSNHNGGRIKFGLDGFLYIGTGDAENPSQAQDTKTLGGKILRVTDAGDIPSDNPFHNPVYSYGHRNVQGLAWDKAGRLWATEHGRSGIQSGLDEINQVEMGKNYGWPIIQGDETNPGMETAKKNSGDTTWAPAGAVTVGNFLFFGGLRGQTLYEAGIGNDGVRELKEHFKGEFGRIREVVLGPDGMLYITTSNKDGRGIPKNGDDKVIRINTSQF